jgi:hypothetical protein
MSLKKVEPVKLDRNKVNEVLDDAKDREFEAVIVFGFKDKLVTVMPSGTTNKLELIGALEVAKQHMWSGQE